MKKFLLKFGLAVVIGQIAFVYGLLYIVNPLLLNSNNFIWLILMIILEDVLYKTWLISTAIYFVYAAYYIITNKRIKNEHQG